MKKIVSRILVGILIFILLLSIVSPAFAASAASDEVGMQSTSEPVEPVYIVLAIIALGAIPAASFLTLKFANEWRYRNRAERLIRENMPYVKLTGLPINEIRNHFAKFANRNGHIRNMNNHFLEELYSLFLTRKSEELAATDEATVKSKEHLDIRAAMYRKLLVKNYTYNDFLNLRPLNAETAARVFEP